MRIGSVDRARLGRALRFASVGALSGLLYMLCVWGQVQLLALAPAVAAPIAYVLILPLNFVLQKRSVFASDKPALPEVMRFLGTHGVAIVVSYAVMALMTQAAGLSHWVGSIAVILAVPFVTFPMLEGWVFAEMNMKQTSPTQDKAQDKVRSPLLAALFSQQASPFLWRVAQNIIGGTPGKRAILQRAYRGEQRVVEIGCSIGNVARQLVRQPNVQYLGLDIDQGALAYARKWFADFPAFQFSSDSFDQLAARGESFDLVCVTGVLHHVDDQVAREILRGARDVCAKQGRLLMFDPIPLRAGDSLTYRLIHKLVQGPYLREPSVLRAIIEEAGFVIESEDMPQIGPGIVSSPKIMTFSVMTARPKE